MKKILGYVLSIIAVLVVVTGCGSGSKDSAKDSKDGKDVTVKLGVVGEDTDVWDTVQKRLKDDGINLEYVKFTDYSQPNVALDSGDIDLNAFQTQIFLDNFNKEHGTDIVSIGNTVNAPLGIYSEKIKDIKELKDGDTVAIPNDITNGGRALLLLQTAGLIKVDSSKKQIPTVSDITENKLNLKIEELDASQTPRSLQDVKIATINSGVAVDAGYNPTKDAIFLEPLDDASKPYVNIIAVKKENENNKTYQKIVDAYQTEDTKKVIEETSKGAIVPSWETFGKK